MINGVPQVVEEPGLRLLLPLSDSGPSIEPSITDKDTQQSLGRRFDTASWSDATGTVSGQVRIEPPKTVPAGIGMVTLSVDDTVVGSTNTPPFQVSWDTTAFSNGVHDLTFTLADAEGTGTTIQDENLNVLNSGSNGDESALLPPGLIARLWNAMKIGPDYKVAEYELALSLEKSHDESGYETHILRAAALDPDYRDVRDRIHPLFIGQVPSAFPVPPGMSLPRSLGLSAGSASAAGFWAGSPNVREIALTFDDGPLPIPTAQLLNALQTANAHGTFFVVGMRAQESPNSLRQMAANGNAVEDHTFTHPNLTQILPQHILQEILRTAVVIQATTGLWPHFLRPPGGNTNTLVLETAKACGMSGAFWTIDALPAEESGSSSEVVNWVVSRARPGAIVLMHNGMSATVGAIPQLVQELRERGYKMVTIRQLAADSLAGRKQGT
jgi:peptidoglycan/xylan/chitin deacetylase (PgdA/CDA1 family)